ncbi:flagellar filament capping protein FliD [Metabacillus malikii]|uniref:Flagellar hook-associated protein 2 n=1 Tax=Metabacillus malikii TaxID=1504265 RepID=A0ABT9ZGT8_9BACI|nr:flagellar filament capping protein FliD [Metabacillus malikii]MDQ0231464.1 flagellar hook-associated protein 2 [Metabacillus malikii]
MALRIGGLASGMDTDSIVADLMKAERIPLDKLTKNKTTIEWQRDAYREMNTLLLNFRNQTFDTKLSSTFAARTVTSSMESKVTAVAKGAAGLSSFNISQISQLATAATKVNAGAVSKTGSKIDASASLYSMKDNFQYPNNFGWKTGSVESQSKTAEADGKVHNLTLAEGITIQDIATSASVKVNGKSFTVNTDINTLKTGEVHLAENGTLTFFDDVKKGSTIKVDYAASNRVETFKRTESFKEIQLSRKLPALADGTEVKITVGGTTYTNSGTNKNEILDSGGNVFAKIDNDGKITFEAQQPKDTEVKVSYQQKYFSFDVGSHTSKGLVNERILVQDTESLNTALNKINSSNVGLSAFYDEYKDQVTLTRKETGDFNNGGAEIITTSGFLNDVLRFKSGTESGGTNAEFTINGLTTQRTSNTFEMNGVTFTLKDKLNAAGGTDEPAISINVANDTDKVIENITKYINSYNELVDKIQKKVNEEKYKDYQPLTDTEREGLTDKQQEKWEEMSRSGLLRRDSMLTNLLTNMRTSIYTPVSGSKTDSNYKQMSSIGITTTANYNDAKLVIDEDKLRAAIEDNPDAVQQLFTSDGSTTGEKGILNRLYDNLTTTMNNIKTKAGNANATNDTFTLGKNLNRIESSIDRFEDRLTKIESRYWAQFTAMEKAIQKSNSQMSYLSSYFAQ